MIYVLCVTFIIVLLTVEYFGYKKYNDLAKRLNEMTAWSQVREEMFNVERQQLLDRIQAPSYDHLKHHEVKIIKAQNNEKEPPKLEVL